MLLKSRVLILYNLFMAVTSSSIRNLSRRRRSAKGGIFLPNPFTVATPAREASVSSFRINAFSLNSHHHHHHYHHHSNTTPLLLPLPLPLPHPTLHFSPITLISDSDTIMSDWDNVTRIGQKHTGSGAPRETTIKGKSALNAASRQGLLVGSEKKYATGNAVCCLLSPSSLFKRLC